MRFRRVLVRLGLERVLFEAVARPLDAGSAVAKCATLVDAALLPPARIQHDVEARWVGHRRREPVHGTKAHVATEQGAVSILRVEITTANVHDAARLNGDAAARAGRGAWRQPFASAKSDRLILTRGGTPLIVQTGVWDRPDALVRLKTHNAVARKVRCRIEKVHGTCKRSYGLRRMR
ncbi:MAG: transposase [Janthinobacterium lividum]